MTETLADMIEFDLKDRGIRDPRVLDAFRRVDRKLFVPDMEKWRAYDDRAYQIVSSYRRRLDLRSANRSARSFWKSSSPFASWATSTAGWGPG